MILQTFLIALGSNKGNKLHYLQTALHLISSRLGIVTTISKVYQSPAMGFKSDAFYNCCISLQTNLNPEDLLQKLLQLEIELGRVRTKNNGYEAREIDIDIIYADALVINTPLLKVPHPEMQHRKFVLQPICDIAPNTIHPVLNITNAQLLQHCKDLSNVIPIQEKLTHPLQKLNFLNYNYIAIEGNIGAGKTSLATLIAKHFNAKLVLERFSENPFLPKFYSDPSRYAFPLEMSFLADRYQQVNDDFMQFDLFKSFVISDYDVNKSLIFSKITLQPDEFILYKKLFYMMYKSFRKPDLYVYLYQHTEQLQKHIKNRGRSYEQNINADYLDKINIGYLEFLNAQTELNIKKIDITTKDFVNNFNDYLWLLNAICN